MEAAATANGVKLLEAFMYRFHPRTERVLEMVRKGEIGELKQIRSTFTFPLTRPEDIRWDRDLGGGALMDVGCYCVNMSRTVVGREPVEVRAMANFRDQRSGPADGRDPPVRERTAGPFRLCPHHGEVRGLSDSRNQRAPEGSGGLRCPEPRTPSSNSSMPKTILTHWSVPGADEYRLMVEHFADCVLNDGPLRYSAEEAALNMRVIEALLKSARDDGEIVAVG